MECVDGLVYQKYPEKRDVTVVTTYQLLYVHTYYKGRAREREREREREPREERKNEGERGVPATVTA